MSIPVTVLGKVQLKSRRLRNWVMKLNSDFHSFNITVTLKYDIKSCIHTMKYIKCETAESQWKLSAMNIYTAMQSLKKNMMLLKYIVFPKKLKQTH